MSKTSNSVIQNKNFILAAVFGFGGMLTAILASIAVVTPLVNAQVNSTLALQSTKNAQLSSAPVHSVTATTSDSCTAPVSQSAHADDDHDAIVSKKSAGHAASMYTASFTPDWKKAAHPASIDDSYNNNGNTTHTSNVTKNIIITKDSNNTIGSHNDTTVSKADKVEITTKDSYNNDSFNQKTINKTDITVEDSFNTTKTKNVDSNNIASGNTVIASGNTDNSDNSTTTDIKNEIENTVIKDNGNTVNSNNDVLSHNDVDVEVDSNNVDQEGIVNVNES